MTGSSTQILLAHVRRWTSDRRFFRMLRNARFAVQAATSSSEEEDEDSEPKGVASKFTNGGSRKGGSLHERGACRIFRIHRTMIGDHRQQVHVPKQ